MRFMKKLMILFLVFVVMTVSLAACNGKENVENNQFYLTIGADNVKSIGLTTKYTSGGCVNADSSLFEKGKRIWLESLDGHSDLRGVTITALDEKGSVIWSASIPDDEENSGVTRLTQGEWIIEQ